MSLAIIIFIFGIVLHLMQGKNIMLGPRNNDTLFHLLSGREIHERKALLDFHERYYPGKKVRYNYPPILHLCISFLTGKFSEGYLRLLSLIMNFSIMLCLLVFCQMMGYSFGLSLLASTLFLLIPINVREAVAVTPRPLGMLFFFMTFFFATYALHNGSFGFYFLSVFSLALLFLSHRMGTQLVFLGFLTNLHLVFTSSPNVKILYFLWLPLGLGIALFISKGQYQYVFKDHLKRLLLHFKFGPQTGEKRKLINPLKLILMNPFLLFLGVLMVLNFSNLMHSKIPILWNVSLVSFVLSIFWVWGDGERHLIFIGPFMPLLFLELEFQNYPILIVAFSLLALGMSLYYLRGQDGAHIIDTETFQLFDFLNKARGELLLLLPNISSPAVAYYVKKKIFSHPNDSGAVEFNRLKVRNHVQEEGFLKALIQNEGIDIVCKEKKFNSKDSFEDLGLSKSFENSRWEVFLRDTVETHSMRLLTRSIGNSM